MAYLTAAILKNEGAWTFVPWQPVIANSTDFDTWIGTIVTRASNYVKYRVGATNYATSDSLLQAIFQEAELARAQFYLLMASAGIADTSDDASLVPFLQSGPKLLADAHVYAAQCELLIAPYYVTLGQAWALPGSLSTSAVPESIPDFTETVQYEEPNTP